MAKVLGFLWNYRSSLILLVTPVLLLPLPTVFKSTASSCAYCILLMGVYWITEALSLGVTALLPLALFPLMGVMSAAEVSKAFMNNATWNFVGVLIFALGVEETGLHKRLALKTLLLVGTPPHRVMLGVMLSSFFLTLWTSKIAVAAMMMPILESIIEELEEGNKISPGLEDGGGEEAFSKEERADPKESETEDGRKPVCKTGTLIRKDRNISTGLTLSVPYATSISGICNPVSATNLILASQYQILFPNSPIQLSFPNWFVYNLPPSFFIMSLTYVWMGYKFFGFSKEMIPFKKTEQTEVVVKIRKILTREYDQLGNTSYGEMSIITIAVSGVLLWFTRDPGFIGGWGSIFVPGFVADSTVSICMALSLFFLPKRKPACFGGNKGPSPFIISWTVVHQKFPWELFMLVGGSFIIAEGAKVSGLTLWVGEQLEILYQLPTWAICLVMTIISCLLTECVTNVSVISLLIPISSAMATVIGVHPIYLLMPMVTASSLAFMLPVATPTNALAYAYGRLKVADLIKTGWMLNLIGIFVINLFINTYGVSFFNMDEFPGWMYQNENTTAVASINSTRG